MKKLWIENITNPAVLFQENDPGGVFEDKSDDILSWYNSKNILTWFLRRGKISPLFYSVAGNGLENFAGLTTEIKLIACELFLIPYSVRMQLISNEQDILNWGNLLTRSKYHRKECIERMRLYTGDYMRTGILTLAQSQQFFNDVSEYIYRYEETNGSEFKAFIDGTDGVFETKDYYSTGLQTGLLNIYTGESWE